MYHGVNTLTVGLPATAVATGVAASSPVGHALQWGWLAVAVLTLGAAGAAVMRLLPVWRRRSDAVDPYPAAAVNHPRHRAQPGGLQVGGADSR